MADDEDFLYGGGEEESQDAQPVVSLGENPEPEGDVDAVEAAPGEEDMVPVADDQEAQVRQILAFLKEQILASCVHFRAMKMPLHRVKRAMLSEKAMETARTKLRRRTRTTTILTTTMTTSS